MTDQEHVTQILVDQGTHHVVDMGVEPYRWREQMYALGETGQGDGHRVMARAAN